MSRRFVDYSIPNGDRDLDDDKDLATNGPVEIDEGKSAMPETEECKNLVVKVIAQNQEKGQRINVKTMPIPRAFDLEFYQTRIDNANFNHDRIEAVRAVAVKRYADIVYEFYKNVMFVFNKKNGILDMPEYINLSGKVPCNIENLAEVMKTREKDLIRVYAGTGNLIKAFDKLKHLTELKHFAAQAWLMYYNLNNLNDFIGYLRYIQQCNDKADTSNPSHIANLYGLHIQAGYYLDANIKNFFNTYNNGFLSRKNRETSGMYSDLKSMEQFNFLLKEKNAYIYADNNKKIFELAKTVPEGTIEKRVIGFYDHYRDMKYIKHKLRHIYKNSKDEEVSDIFMFQDRNNVDQKFANRDVFVVGIKYYSACKEMVEKLPVRSKIYRDVCDMCAELEEILLLNQEKHKICAAENKKLEKEILEKFPHIAALPEEEKPIYAKTDLEN